MKRLLSILIFAIVLVGCADQKTKDPYMGLSQEAIMHEGMDHMSRGSYAKAAEDFEGLESHYPFGDLSERAQLYSIYAYYKADESGSALAAADKFIRFHPTHAHADYAYFMRGLVHYEDAFPTPQRYLPVDEARHDQSNAEAAFTEFSELVRRFPNGTYTEDAKRRLIYLRDILARSEMLAADFYMRRGAYIAAVNRCDYVLEHFQGTKETIHALEVMVKAYRALALNDLADDAERALQFNVQGHRE